MSDPNIRPSEQRVVVNAPGNLTPVDQIRWGPILAGLFTAASCMIVLSVLGIAIGLSAYDAGDTGRAFGIAAGWWGGLSALISFFIGGWIAARGAALRNSKSALMNGAMVWAVAIPFMLFLMGTALSGVAATAAQTGAAMTRQPDQMESPLDQARAAAGRLGERLSAQDAERAAGTGATSAWWTLAALLLGLGAALVGGYAGASGRRYIQDVGTTRTVVG